MCAEFNNLQLDLKLSIRPFLGMNYNTCCSLGLQNPLRATLLIKSFLTKARKLTCCRALTGELWTLIFILWVSILQKITLIWCITAFCSRNHAVYCSDVWASWDSCILGSIAYGLFQHSHCCFYFITTSCFSSTIVSNILENYCYYHKLHKISFWYLSWIKFRKEVRKERRLEVRRNRK